MAQPFDRTARVAYCTASASTRRTRTRRSVGMQKNIIKRMITAARASSSRVAPIVQFVRKAATFEFMQRLMLSSTCNSYRCTNNGGTLVSAFSTSYHSIRQKQRLIFIGRDTWITVCANDSSIRSSLDPTRTNFLIVALRICKPVDQQQGSHRSRNATALDSSSLCHTVQNKTRPHLPSTLRMKCCCADSCRVFARAMNSFLHASLSPESRFWFNSAQSFDTESFDTPPAAAQHIAHVVSHLLVAGGRVYSNEAH